MDEEAADWDPDSVSIVQGEWHPQALEILRSTKDFSKYKLERVVRFVRKGRAEGGPGEAGCRGGAQGEG